jgi:hypothetical protein
MSENTFYQDILNLEVGKTLYPKLSKDNKPIRNLYNVQIKPNDDYLMFLEELINSEIKYPIYKTQSSNYYICFFKNGDMDMSKDRQMFKFIQRGDYINAVLI